MALAAPDRDTVDIESIRRARGVTPVLAGVGMTVAVMQTLMVPLLPQLPSLLHTSRSAATWVITVTLLAAAASTPVLGRLGDMYGKRRVLLASVAMLIAGSLLCGFASSLVPMLIGRGLQGCSIGTIALGISIMRDELPPQRLGSSVGLMSSSLGVGGAFGIPAAAVVAEHFDWHTLFFGAAALGALGFVMVVLVVPESPVRSGGRFDVAGALGLSTGLVFLLLAISKGADWGWGSGLTLGLFAAAVVVLVLWGAVELRVAEPLVNLRTSARRQVLLTNLTSVMVGFALYATQLVPIQLLRLPVETGYGLGQSMLAAGLCIAPTGLFMMAASQLGARLIERSGPKMALLTGISVLGAAYLVGLVALYEPWQLALFSALAGTGVGLAYAAMPTLIIDAVPASETAAANGLNALMRSVGTASSAAVVGMVLAHMTTGLGAAAVPTLTGFRVSLLIAGGACALALLIGAFIPGGRAEQDRKRQ
ncbi:MFS transporter [Nocardia sp. NBC_00565]|uniref:MFS transporter n=1 Tax=Nocardia sp. NBC_00565 TaxID=2975993 RepID=UPI002E7FB8B4|nr:MFS transporter [Nocardia sp. NBC_00565]WUC05745.1 MFS transporter [Nocardia sp. NBC_00565]